MAPPNGPAAAAASAAASGAASQRATAATSGTANAAPAEGGEPLHGTAATLAAVVLAVGSQDSAGLNSSGLDSAGGDGPASADGGFHAHAPPDAGGADASPAGTADATQAAAGLRHKLAVLTKAFRSLRDEKAAAEAQVAALVAEVARLRARAEQPEAVEAGAGDEGGPHDA